MKGKVIGFLLIPAILATLFIVGLVGWAKSAAAGIDLPPLEAAGRSVVLAADGKTVIGEIASAEAGRSLAGKDVSPLIRNAHLAAEDRSFYQHGAISLTGLGWAMFKNMLSGSLSAGGSGVIQQLAKRYARNRERTIEAKINELPYAYRIEEDYTKDEILVHYVNSNGYGRGAYGVDDAARTWFGVSAKELDDLSDPEDVARAAFLAGLIKAPNDYDDYRGKKPSRLIYADTVWGRTRYVLDGLRDVKGTKQLPSKETVEAAKALLPLKLTDKVKNTGSPIKGDPYVMRYIQDWMTAWQTEIARQDDGLTEAAAKKEGQLAAETLLARGGLRIVTSLNPNAQDALVNAHKNRFEGGGPSGFVVLDPRNGGVIAMSGGKSYKADALNYAVYTSRPPGSTMKPFVLANAVEEGVSVQSVFAAPSNIKIDGPAIWNSNKKAAPGCTLNLVDAMAQSNNPVHVEMVTGRMASCDSSKTTEIKDWPISPKSVAELMHKAGADSSPVPGRKAPAKIGEEPRLGIGSSLELSPLKLGVMASTLANGGEYHKPYVVREIGTPNGGDPIFNYGDEGKDDSERVLEEDTTRIVNRVLTRVFTEGTARSAQVEGHPLAGKTGTTDSDLGDAWGFAFNAISDDHKREPAGACAGWGGKNANRHGADVMRVCQGFFQSFLRGRPKVDFPKADFGEGERFGIEEPVNPPPPPPATTEPEPEPEPTTPSPTPTEEPSEEPTKPTEPTKEPRPEDPPPTTKRPRPTPTNEGGEGNGPAPNAPGIP